MELKLIIEEFILNYGLISIFLIVALEYANAPLPSEIVLPVVGFMALEFDMNLILVIITSILGGVFGSIINYYLGQKFGNPLISYVIKKYPKVKTSVKESYRWLNKYGKISVMLSRLVPLARTFISIIAGVTKVPLVEFVLYSTIGISVWNVFLILLGYIVGDNANLIAQTLSKYSVMIGLVLFVGIVLFIIKSRLKNKTK
ncbi:MAG: DedA family protein [Peptostreptococcaceae bacterium]